MQKRINRSSNVAGEIFSDRFLIREARNSALPEIVYVLKRSSNASLFSLLPFSITSVRKLIAFTRKN